MRILAISDLHGNLPEIPDCDLLLIAGDVCPDFHQASFARYGSRTQTFDKGEQRQRHWLDTDFRAWLENLANRDISVVGIAGNHDFVFEHPFLVPDLPWTYLKDSETTYKKEGDPRELRIYGTPWVPKLNRWAFYASEKALQARADAIPDGIDILISHGPPFGLCDRVVPKFGDTHVGDVPLLSALQRVKPTYVVCGHIHEGYGTDSMETEDRTVQIQVVNCAHVDENYSDNFRAPMELSAYLTAEDF